MSKNLLIVESPAKAKTIKKYLGKDFSVLASYGHVRDLIPKSGAIDVENNFAMNYDIIAKNTKHVAAIAKALKEAEVLYLATDPDREGEAISWHLCELLRAKKILQKKPVYRVVFHEITKSAIKDAVAHPREISMDLVDAQQARRALDYLVGFTLSPLLWKKIRYGLSAGRVQSPALRMIVERETEIEQFKIREYWTIIADTEFSQQKFTAKLIEYQGNKVEQFTIISEKQAIDIKQNLSETAQGKLLVTAVEKKQRKRHPSPPFITSTLQQEAARKLGFSARRTMIVAQQLYEGITVSEGTVGLITYMRTDSVNLAKEALDEIRELIKERFDADSLPDKPNFYRTKAKNAQEAHEAIRPTSVRRTPELVAKFLSPEQLKLYSLIWKRTVASQMIYALINVVAVDLNAGKGNTFRANGSTIINYGFIAVYQEGLDDAKQGEIDKDSEKTLPALKEGDQVSLLDIISEQHFTEPPPRYTEASLIKTLEEYGIGRPSTYAAIIDTLLSREYVMLDNKRFKPTDVGRIVNKFLINYFSEYVDYDFTAKLEDQLDEVARGESKYLPLLKEFWHPFKKQVDVIGKQVKREDVTQEILEEKCPKCEKPLSSRLGKNGSFIGCTGYPECDYTRNIANDSDSKNSDVVVPENIEGRVCPQCESALQIKTGKYGKFIGCSNYPKCKHMEPLEKPLDSGILCPVCKKGNLIRRKSRFGTYFYSCNTYPTCKYAVWHQPIAEKCVKCGWPILTLKTTKRYGTQKICPQKECAHVSVEE